MQTHPTLLPCCLQRCSHSLVGYVHHRVSRSTFQLERMGTLGKGGMSLPLKAVLCVSSTDSLGENSSLTVVDERKLGSKTFSWMPCPQL